MREITVRLENEYLQKNGKTAGVQGSGNVNSLLVTFGEEWDGFAKTAVWWDARGQNPVKQILGADAIVDITEDPRTYRIFIPPEPLAFAGTCRMVIDGYQDGKRARSVVCELDVLEAPVYENAEDPTDPTPSQAEQLQQQIEKLLGNIRVYAVEAKSYAVGGTGSREGEDTDNAMYYAGAGGEYAYLAKTYAEGQEKGASLEAVHLEAGMTYATTAGGSGSFYIDPLREYTVTVNEETDIFRADMDGRISAFNVSISSDFIGNSENDYAVTVSLSPVDTTEKQGAWDYMRTAGSYASAAEDSESNAKAWAEGGFVIVDRLEPSGGAVTAETIGAKGYAQQAQESAGKAADSKDAAASFALEAAQSSDSAAADKNYCAEYKSDAAQSASEAAQSAKDALNSQQAAESSKNAAGNFAEAAEERKNEAEHFSFSASDFAQQAYNAAQEAAENATREVQALIGEQVKNAAESAQSAQNFSVSASESASIAQNSKQSAASSAEKAFESAEDARNAQKAIENMTVTSKTLEPEDPAYAHKTLVNGVVNVEYGIPKGKTGSGFRIFGYFSTLEELQEGVNSPKIGDAYGVGILEPYDIYIWDGTQWVNNGPIQGPAGNDGKSAYESANEGGFIGTEQEFNKALASLPNKADKVTGASEGNLAALDESGNLTDSGKKPTDFGGKRTARFTVGTSAYGWNAGDCDYLCDGTDDQVEINAAIQALLSTGGEIVILDGTYNITSSISVNKDNVKLSGNGAATVLKRMWDSSSNEGVVSVTSANGKCCIENFLVDGNATEYTSSRNCGIYADGGNYNTFKNNICINNYIGIYLNYGRYSTVIGNTCVNNETGIYLNNTFYSPVTGNICDNNGESGIQLNYGSGSNPITGNTCNKNKMGISLRNYSDVNSIIGNICNNNNINGIFLNKSSKNNISGNIIFRGSGSSSDYTSSQNTINCSNEESNYNLICSNNIMGKNYADKGTNNTFANNKFE